MSDPQTNPDGTPDPGGASREPTLASRATVLIAAGSATIAFMLGFNYGAFGVIFFEQVFTVWVISTVVTAASKGR